MREKVCANQLKLCLTDTSTLGLLEKNSQIRENSAPKFSSRFTTFSGLGIGQGACCKFFSIDYSRALGNFKSKFGKPTMSLLYSNRELNWVYSWK